MRRRQSGFHSLCQEPNNQDQAGDEAKALIADARHDDGESLMRRLAHGDGPGHGSRQHGIVDDQEHGWVELLDLHGKMKRECELDRRQQQRGRRVDPEQDADSHNEPRPCMRHAKPLHADDDGSNGQEERADIVSFSRIGKRRAH